MITAQETQQHQQNKITHTASEITDATRQTDNAAAAAPVRLTYAEVEYLMTLCLTTASSGGGAGTSNDALLGKLAMAWRRHYRMV